jgi:hypothetical protein
MHPVGGKRGIWVLGMYEGNLRSWVIGVFLNFGEVTAPNSPRFRGVRKSSLFSRTPLIRLTTRCLGGEQVH